ncbi:MAG: glutamate racemase [Prevotellaceae bacterium]|jgi:glutamate racemase|nr:glutamate racemase [Prevotellaceae bacterium]
MKIGIFDSGYGGLTILEKIVEKLPQYDYIYLGDNARTPYGSRSFEVVYQYTLQCVKKLFEMDCQLIILACNTASAEALRNIQQADLQRIAPSRKVLGVIRPTVEKVDEMTASKTVGLFGTSGTVQSKSYEIEIAKLFPHITVVSEACPIWVPLIENNEHTKLGADYFVKQHIDRLLEKKCEIDAVILGCTHYPLLVKKIEKYLPQNIKIITQGKLVAESLENYLFRHPEHENLCTKNSTVEFFTTESVEKFVSSASIFLKQKIQAKKVFLG